MTIIDSISLSSKRPISAVSIHRMGSYIESRTSLFIEPKHSTLMITDASKGCHEQLPNDHPKCNPDRPHGRGTCVYKDCPLTWDDCEQLPALHRRVVKGKESSVFTTLRKFPEKFGKIDKLERYLLLTVFHIISTKNRIQQI